MRISDWSSDVCSSDLLKGINPSLHLEAQCRRTAAGIGKGNASRSGGAKPNVAGFAVKNEAINPAPRAAVLDQQVHTFAIPRATRLRVLHRHWRGGVTELAGHGLASSVPKPLPARRAVVSERNRKRPHGT